MGEKAPSVYFSQLRAMLIRNLLLKKREKRKTTAEVLLPLYSLAILIVMKILIPNPNFPVMSTPRGDTRLFGHFGVSDNHTVAVVPNSTEVQQFLTAVDSLWAGQAQASGQRYQPINWLLFPNREELVAAYWREPEDIPIAVIFEQEPVSGQLEYSIRTNPSFVVTPSTTELFSSPASCRQSAAASSHWPTGGVFPIETGDSCPVVQYYYSGFVALQALLDYTKIRLDSGDDTVQVPRVLLESFPKEAYTGDWMVAFRVVIPLYMVMALSQFITYLLILIVGEKENKIKEGMKIMGLKDSVFWLSWFIIYGVFVLFLSVVSCVLLFTLRVFQNTNFFVIFILVVLYSLSIIMFGFMLTPFFDKSRTAGILGNFAVNIMSLLYFIQVFVDDSNSVALWLVSLISSTGFALAMDRALVLDLSGEGVNFDNLWSGQGIPFGGSLIMMALDIVLYALLAYYLDSVVPSEHGTKRSPWFCFTPAFWCGKKSVARIPATNGESGTFNNSEEQNRDVEQVPREMKGREAIRIVDLYKSFHDCRKPEMKAVNGINLTIYEGQITAILGHNGAGKTTLFNILTGLTAPTAGTAYVFGYDIRDPNDMQAIRRMTGVCPQHDILFDLLTPREHLEFFAAVRGIPHSLVEFEVTKTLKDIDLVDKADTFAKYLSGGQKRKLSVGIAVIGDPKIIILDEPTAGVDPYSRRHMWSVLQNRRHGKVILLTTHFMDEADILADRKAVVSRGRLRCCGSSLFLKNKFGIGYHLTLVLEGVCREHAINRLVTSHVPKAEKARRHGRELSFILPHNAVDNFAPLFSAIEQEISTRSGRLGISSYGVSMTTLEEVFLHLERDEETDGTMDNLSKKMVRNRALSRSLSLQSKSTSYQSLQNETAAMAAAAAAAAGGNGPRETVQGLNNSQALTLDGKACGDLQLDGIQATPEVVKPGLLGLGLENIEAEPNCWQTMTALLRLRTLRLFRDLQKLYFMILLPLGLAAVGLYLNSVQTVEPKMKSLVLNSSTYRDFNGLALHNGSDHTLDEFIDSLAATSGADIDLYNGNFSLLLEISPHMAALNVNTLHLQNLSHASLTMIYNDTAQHSLPIIINFINNALYKMILRKKDLSEIYTPIQVQTHPFQQTSQPEEFNIGIFSSSVFIGMIFVLIPASLSIDMVYDREVKAKNQLRVNGLSFFMYFFTYFVVLAALMVLICVCLLVLILVFDLPSLKEPPAFCTFTILVLLYCPASILFSTCVSYIFDKMDSAMSILPNISTFVGMIPFALVIILDMLRIGGKAAFALHCVFSLLNTMYTPYAVVYYVQRVHLMCQVNGACTELTVADYLTDEIIVMFVGTLLHIPVWFVVLLALDVKKNGGKVRDAFSVFGHKKACILEDPADASDVSEHEDDDVKAERQKVSTLLSSTDANSAPLPLVMVQNLHKTYTRRQLRCCSKETEEEAISKVAVRNLSLAVESGEVFGLLGHNGAGKTTTMRIMIAEEAPTRGKVQIGGHSVTSSMAKAFQIMGYCPQHDAQWKNITVREHLECYAAIRGVPTSDISRVVDGYLTGLQIREHAAKQTQHCSGGTRRKLSFAMAMVGGPKVVLLDEPSTGMDPRSKRFLWDTILASFQECWQIYLEHAEMQSNPEVLEASLNVSKINRTTFALNYYGILKKDIPEDATGKRSAILTTHSMEEADALCSRVGIMVKGSLRCLGSTQHLKNRYGAGYTLEMKVRGGERTPGGERPRDHTAFVAQLFPAAQLQEAFADRLVFSVPQQAVESLAQCFTQLEKAKSELDIEEYSFSQTTLEQVFLKFAHYDEVNDE